MGKHFPLGGEETFPGYLSELFPLGMGRNSGYLSEYLTLHCLLGTPISDLEVCENGQGGGFHSVAGHQRLNS